MSDKDHFSSVAGQYRKFRPRYPAELFSFLAGLCETHGTAWDAGCGSGQAAVGLAPFFETVIATDFSPLQLQQAERHPKVRYRAAPAEDSAIADASVDLVTVGQALHWFSFPRFFDEVMRVLVPRGVIAVWTYNLFRIDHRVDEIVRAWYENVLGSYWPPERRHVEDGYAHIPFPFDRIEAPAFSMTAEWTFQHLVGYLGTWSAVKRCREATGSDPVGPVVAQLEHAWGTAETRRTVRWPLVLKVGRR